MAEFDQEEFSFPDEENKKVAVKADADEFEFIVEDDTPEEDRGKKPMPEEVVKKLETANEDEEELDLKAQKERLKQYKKVWNDERRAKEAALREQQEAIELAKRYIEENKRLKETLTSGEKTYIETVQTNADLELQAAKAAYREAIDSGDADKLVEAQSKLTEATYKAQQAKNFKPNISLQSEESVVKSPQVEQQPAKVDAKTQNWLDANPWYGSKKAMSNYAVGIHEELIDDYGPGVVGTDK